MPANAELARRELEALARALPADAAEPADDVTLAGSYDAATVGVEMSEAVAPPPLASGVELKSSQGPIKSVIEATATQTVAHNHTKGRRPEPPDHAGTMGWGSQPELVEETRVPAAEGGSHPAAEVQRRSVTPPPISSSHPPASAVGSGSSLKWVLATAVVSFGIALGISQLLSGREVEPDIDPVEPAGTAPPESTDAEAANATAETEVPPPAAETGPPSSSGTTTPVDAEDKDSKIERQSANEPAPAPPSPTAPQPKATRPAPAPVPGKTKKALPGSGRWGRSWVIAFGLLTWVALELNGAENSRFCSFTRP